MEESGEIYQVNAEIPLPPEVQAELGYHALAVHVGQILHWMAAERDANDGSEARKLRRIADKYYREDGEDG